MVIFQALIEKGANIEAKGQNQQTPLQTACLNGHLPIVQFPIEKGANIGKTPFDVVCNWTNNSQRDIRKLVK